jgi:hypothetical protein
MKYFLAFCIWLPLCYGINYLDWHYGGFVANTPIIFLIRPPQSWGILFVVCMGAAFMFGRSRLAGVPAKVGELPPDIAARFPPNRIFYVTDRQRRNPLISKEANYSYAREDVDWWRTIMEAFPKPPTDSADSKKREMQLWSDYLHSYFLVGHGDGTFSMKPRQDIIDKFRNEEKWIFRYYYAATGDIKKSIYEDFFRLLTRHDDLSGIRSMRLVATEQERISELKQTRSELDSFARNKIEPHMEKWGEWFFSNIEDAFRAVHAKASDFGPPTATTPPQHPAQDDLSYRPNT